MGLDVHKLDITYVNLTGIAMVKLLVVYWLRE